MLALPFKATPKVDVAGPMKAYLTARYSEADATRHAGLLTDFQMLRNDVASISVANEGAREALLRYLGQLDFAKAKFPVNEGATGIEFRWTDSLRPSVIIGQYSWEYERACVLYNIAALESAFGNGISRATEEGVKAAKRHYTCAASLLAHIRDSISAKLVGTLPMDLSHQGLTMMVLLQQAQAQACAFEMAQLKNTKPDLIAQVAGQCADYYRSALRALPEVAFADIDPISIPWSVYLTMHMSTFDGVSFWSMSKVAKEEADAKGSGYGMELGWLQVAENACLSALGVVKTSKYANAKHVHTGSADALLARVRSRKADADRDNKTIYFNIVVGARELPVVPRVDLAKLGPLPDFSSYSAKDMFEAIVPVEVATAMHQLEDIYESRSKAAKERCDNAKAAAKQQLAAMGLPGCLDSADSTPGLPSGLWDRVKRTQIEGGLVELDRLLASNMSIAAQAVGVLDQVKKMLADEAAADANFRELYGDKWNAVPSDLLTVDLKGDLAKYETVSTVATTSDSQVKAKIAAHRAKLEALSKTKAELDSTIPAGYAPAGGRSSEADNIRQQLIDTLAQLDNLFAERVATCEALKTSFDRRAAVSMLVTCPPGEYAAPLAKLGEAVTPASRQLEQTFETQQSLLESIAALHARFSEVRALDDKSRARENAIQELSETVDKYEEIRSNLREGEKFYRELKNKAELLRSQAEGLVNARSVQQREMQMELQTRSEAEKRAHADAELAARLASSWSTGATTAPANAYPTMTSWVPATPGPVPLPSTAGHAMAPGPAVEPSMSGYHSTGAPSHPVQPSYAPAGYSYPSGTPTYPGPSTYPGPGPAHSGMAPGYAGSVTPAYAPAPYAAPNPYGAGAYMPYSPAPVPAPAPTASPQVQELLLMGFDRAKAEAALVMAKNDVNQAVQLLLDNRV